MTTRIIGGAAVVVLLIASPLRAAASYSEPVSRILARPMLLKQDMLAQIGGPPRDQAEKSEVAPSGPRVIDPRKAMLFSLLIPGLGQQAAGRKYRARAFYAVEAGIWASFVTFRLQGDARKDRYIEFAEFAGGVSAAGKDDDYWRTIGIFERSDPGPYSANEFVRRQARALYPGDMDAQKAYLAEHGYFGDRAWDWRASGNLDRYKELRTRSLDAYDRSRVSIALAIANRILSAIDAARTAVSANKAAASRTDAGDLKRTGQFGLGLMKEGHGRVPVLTYKLRF